MEQINVNLIPGKVLPVCHVSQFDENRQIKVNLFDGENVFAFSGGDSAELNVKKPDTTIVTTALTVAAAQTYVELTTSQQMTAVAGANMCEIKITHGAQVIGTLNFIMQVEESPLNNGVESDSAIHDLTNQVERIMDAVITKRVNEISGNTNNLFNINQYEDAAGVTLTDGELFGTSPAYMALPDFDITYKPNTQYTVTLDAKIKTSAGTGNGLVVYVVYSDSTSENIIRFKRNQTNYLRNSGTTAAGKTVQRIKLTYSTGNSDEWYARNIQVEEGTVGTEYIPFKTADDEIARRKARITDELQKDVYYVNNWAYANYDSVTGVIQFSQTRIGNVELVPVERGDIIRISNGTGYKHAWRIWPTDNTPARSRTWNADEEEIEVTGAGLFGVKYEDENNASNLLDLATFDGACSIIRKAYANDLQKLTTPTTKGCAYSWWVNNRAVDSYGNLYVSYISEKAVCGVLCRFPDGTIYRRDLFQAEDKDDHNAPSVLVVTKDGAEYVFVIGCTGHNYDNKINVFMATEPNSINCEFINKSFEMTAAPDFVIQTTYSQAFFEVFTSGGVTYNRIVNFFRVKELDTINSTYQMCWMCAMSDDYGDNWTIYRAFTAGQNISEKLFYMSANDTRSNVWLKRVVLQYNTTNVNEAPIAGGFINTRTLNILDWSVSDIGHPMTEWHDGEHPVNNTIAEYSDFTPLVYAGGSYALRILDVWENGDFLFAKAVQSAADVHDVTDWGLYLYSGGNEYFIDTLGLAFFVGSAYVTGANFVGDESHVVYSKNDSTTQDGAHSLHLVELSGGAVVSDKIIKRSGQLLARPMRYDRGGLMALAGQYREGQGTKYLTWHFGIEFFDSI